MYESTAHSNKVVMYKISTEVFKFLDKGSRQIVFRRETLL